MEKKYSAKYEETKEALIAFCEIFHQEKCEMSVLIAVAFGGVVLLGLNIVGGNLSGSSREVFLFLVKYVSMWITAFFAGAILSKTLFRRMMMSTAFGDAQELYRLRIKKRSKPLVVRVDFYEVEQKLYFGELTFFPCSGFMPFKPEEADQRTGEMLKLEKVKKYSGGGYYLIVYVITFWKREVSA